MSKLYLVRHGETEWNVEGRLQGRKNSLLTKWGRFQAALLSERLKIAPIDVIIASPSPRTLETAEIIRNDRDIPIIQDEHFLEIDFGRWDGKLKKDVETSEPGLYKLFWEQPHLYKTESGEDFYQVRERVLPWLKHVFDEYRDKNILIVTHEIVLRVLLSYFDHAPVEKLWEGPAIKSGSLTIIELSADQASVSLHADTSHLRSAGHLK